MGGVFERAMAVSGPLPAEDISLLDALTENVVTIDGSRAIAEEGQSPGCLHIITEGAACLSRTHKGSKRQITAILLPGDYCSMQSCFGDHIDFTLSGLYQVSFAKISRDDVNTMLNRPSIAKAVLMSNIRREAIYRSWVDNIGGRSSIRRLAHLFCELYARLDAVQLVDDGKLPIRINQTQLSNALGLSTVHVNRAIKMLKAKGLIKVESRFYRVESLAKLQDYAGFDGKYLK